MLLESARKKRVGREKITGVTFHSLIVRTHDAVGKRSSRNFSWERSSLRGGDGGNLFVVWGGGMTTKGTLAGGQLVSTFTTFVLQGLGKAPEGEIQRPDLRRDPRMGNDGGKER